MFAPHFISEESFRSEAFFEVLVSIITTISKRFKFPGPLVVHKFFNSNHLLC